MRRDPIRVLACGGTFDKVYDPEKYELGFPKRSHVFEMIQRCFLKEVRCTQLSLKDSLDVSPQDVKEICRAIKAERLSRILVVCGTSRMSEIGEQLISVAGNKTIVLTGAYVPYSAKNSDALFNFGAGLMATRLLGAGLYVTLHGKVLGVQNKSQIAGYLRT